VEVEREWILADNNYNNLYASMLTFFEISTLEMWPGMMYDAIDGVGYDEVPKRDHNVAISFVFVIHIFVTTFFIMNLFISVIVQEFDNQVKSRSGSDKLTGDQKQWVKLQRLLLRTDPKVIPVEPINCFRMHCFKIVQSQAFEYIVLMAIFINTAFLCIDNVDKGPGMEIVLYRSNLFFVAFFTVEMVLKIIAYGPSYYWYVNWNKFDSIVVLFSLISLNESWLE
jgi:hypothetical protein